MADHVVGPKIVTMEMAAMIESELLNAPAVPVGTLKKAKLTLVIDELPNVGPE